MTQYIDKDAVVAEIDDWRDKIKKGIFSIPLSGSERAYATFEYEVLGKVISFLDTLEVKEVDLDNELDFVKDAYYYFTSDERSSMKKVAKHFFELGLKAKEEQQ